MVLDVSASFKLNVSFSVHSTASSCKSPRITTLTEIEEDFRIASFFQEICMLSKSAGEICRNLSNCDYLYESHKD